MSASFFYVCYENIVNARIRDLLKLILALGEVLYVVTQTFVSLAYAS